MVTIEVNEWFLACGFLLMLLHWRSLPLMYHLRMAWLVFTTKLFTPKISSLHEWSTLEFRVYLDDCDWNLHMNNSSYNKMADFGRIHHMLRLGFDVNNHFRTPKLRVGGMNGGTHCRFKRGLGPFESYTLRTRVLSFDKKWIYLEHQFLSGGRIKVACISKLVNKLPDTGEIVTPRECFKILGLLGKMGDADKGSKEHQIFTNEICEGIDEIDRNLGKDT